jgi:hypothetical protein
MSDENEPTVIDDELPVGEPAGGEPAGGEPAAEPAAAPPPDDLRAAMTELAGTVSKAIAPREPEPRQPTPEEVAELWAIYDPEKENKDFFRKFFRFDENTTPEQIDEAKQLFAGMQRGMMRQAIQGARNFIAMEVEKLSNEFGPIREYVEENRREATRERFYGSYPGLSEGKFEKIVESVARSLNDKTFDDEEHYFKELAEGSAVAIKEILPDFDLGKAPETTHKPGQTPRLPRTSAGGGGGAGKGREDVLAATGSRNDIDSLEP